MLNAERPSSPAGPSSGVPSDDENEEEKYLNWRSYNLSERMERLEFVSHAVDICEHAGVASARANVLPLLSQLLQHEECALPIAQQLTALFAACGGTGSGGSNGSHSPRSSISVFLNIMESLCSHVDPKVSEEAADAVRVILSETDDMDVMRGCFAPFVMRLAAMEWTAPRSSAACLLHDIYASSPTPAEKEKVLLMYQSLCADPNIVVKRAATSSLHNWVRVLPPHQVVDVILPLVQQIAKVDKHDTLRIALISQIAGVAGSLSVDTAQQHLLPVVLALCQDDSWRVRYVVAQHIDRLVQAFSRCSSALVPSIVLLSQDEEREVRAVVARQFPSVAKLLPSTLVTNNLIPAIGVMAGDETNVRQSVALAVCEIFASTTASAATTHLCPIVLKLLADAAEPVQVNTISHLHAMGPSSLENPEFSSQVCTILSNAVLQRKEKEWRVRRVIAEQLPHLALVTNRDNFVALVQSCVYVLLSDLVSAVRTSMMASLSPLARVLGSGWSKQVLLTLANKAFGVKPPTTSFVERQTLCGCFQSLLPSLGVKDLTPDETSAFDATLKQLARDPISNVRIAMVGTLKQLKQTPAQVLSNLRAALMEQLKRDSDPDVSRSCEDPSAEAPF